MISKLIKILFNIVVIVIFAPISILRNLLIDRRMAKTPLAEIAEKTRAFLSPQLKSLEAIGASPGTNKFALITMESVLYIIAIGEALGGRTIRQEENITGFYTSILGPEYEPVISSIFTRMRSGRYSADELQSVGREMAALAKADVAQGVLDGSNYLARNAEYLSAKQEELRTLSE